MSSFLKNSTSWVLIFFLIFLLSQDYVSWFKKVELGWGGFPGWMSWVVFLQLLFVGAMILFARYYWKQEDYDE
jgi:uncharacterized membrane protein